ncbi:MAG: SurA N-terminal domain-containing protein [Victivallales bacterium]|nr:SurA N-terminal domain-containing protein [Victivallales bacterium]
MKTVVNTLIVVLLAMAAFVQAQSLELRLLARVGDKVITSFDVQRVSANAEAALPASLTQAQRDEQVRKIREQVLEQLIEEELVYMDFKALKAKLPPIVVQERIDQMVMSHANGDEQRFRDMLHKDNMTFAEFKERIHRSLAIEMLMYDRTNRGIKIKEQEIQEYFDAHAGEFAVPARYRVQVIMLKGDGRYAGKIPATVGEIRLKLQEGASFDELAKAYSEGMNPENGGDLGWQTSMAPVLQKVVDELKAGEVYNGMLNLGANTFVVKLAEKEEGSSGLTPAVRERIRALLTAKAAEKNRRDYVATLNMKYPVRRYR